MKRTGAPRGAAGPQIDYRLTESLRPLPALNFGWVDALICIGSPVRGLRPVEALRCEQEKVPTPTRRTSPPFSSPPLLASQTPSTALPASPLLTPAVSPTSPLTPRFFML